jgi:CDP-diacylglycerol--glycerol-3-phosphate 3-phosphatidyltransferase
MSIIRTATMPFSSPSELKALDSRSREAFWNIPNTLSLLRLLLVGGICWSLDSQQPLVALAIFLIASATDALDGYLARVLSQVTSLGRQLDPLVDKIIVISTLICLVPLAASGVAPWMVVLVVTRELLVQAVRSQIEGRGEPFGARLAGKLKMIAQCVAVSLAIFSVGRADSSRLWLVLARDLSLWVMLALTLYSGIIYLKIAWPRLIGEPNTPGTAEASE